MVGRNDSTRNNQTTHGRKLERILSLDIARGAIPGNTNAGSSQPIVTVQEAFVERRSKGIIVTARLRVVATVKRVGTSASRVLIDCIVLTIGDGDSSVG